MKNELKPAFYFKVQNKSPFLGLIYVEVHVFVLFNISSQEMVKVVLYFVH